MSSETRKAAPDSGFAWLWSCFAGSSLGDGIYQVALPIAALQIGGGASGVALVLGASRAPWLLLPLPGYC